jgi:DOPA 4,5-dioxygenase
MPSNDAPHHAHVYYEAADRPRAERVHRQCLAARDAGELLFVGELRDRPVGPHPKPQFELHFRAGSLPRVLALIESSNLTALVHPLTDDDLADHTTLGTWIGAPLPLDLSVLDPPGRNQGIPRFGKTDF